MNYKLLFTTILLALVFCVRAAPLQDVSVTSVDLAQENLSNKGDEHLFVTVTRVDDLIDDDGTVLAERVMAVRVTFDVVENQLRCNGVPVAIGVSNIEVQAQMTSDSSKLLVDSDEELALLQDRFDVGLAMVEVTATLMDETTTETGLTFRRIAVQEKITEINHEKVVQTETGQQILDIFANGHLDRWAVDPVTGFLLPENDGDHHTGQHQQQQEEENQDNEGARLASTPWMVKNKGDSGSGCLKLLEPMVQWWYGQSVMVRGTFSGMLVVFLFALAFFVRHLIISALPAYEDANQETIWKDDEQNTSPSYQYPVKHKHDGDEKQLFLT